MDKERVKTEIAKLVEKYNLEKKQTIQWRSYKKRFYPTSIQNTRLEYRRF